MADRHISCRHPHDPHTPHHTAASPSPRDPRPARASRRPQSSAVSRRRRRAPGTAAFAAALLLALAGCTSGGAEAAADATDDGPGVVAPGRPGEDAATLSPEEAKAAAEARRQDPNAADLEFMAMMIVHHGQALEMTALAEEHADDPRVRRLAGRISAAQGPEIAMMEAWLAEHEAESGHDHHHEEAADHADMPGMATPAELAALAEARGGAFDRLFLELMSVHHEGAVTMAEEALTHGVERVVNEVATEIAAQQGAEVGRMERLLDQL